MDAKRPISNGETRLQELIREAPTFECRACGTKWGKSGKRMIEYVMPSDRRCKDGQCVDRRDIPECERINLALFRWQAEGCGESERYTNGCADESPSQVLWND